MSKKILIEFNGKIASLSEHCKDLTISVSTVQSRHRRTGESLKDCLQYFQKFGVNAHLELVELNGQLVTKAEYCKRLGYSYNSICKLMHRDKLSFMQAVEEYLKIRRENKYVELNGELVSRKEYCRILGYSYNAITTLMSKYNLFFDDAVYKYKSQRKTKSKRLRNIWHGIKDRCFNTNAFAYKWYGERGITMQDSWKDDYFNFEDDMLESYNKHVEEYGEKNTTLDRIDYNGNYELSNCKWATIKEQANNRRNNFIVVDNLTLTQFSEKYNLSVATVWSRIRLGWTVERIVNTPVKRIFCPITGESVKEIAERLNISENTIRSRLKHNWTWERILGISVETY